jgi:hypothetical protein
MVAVVVVALVVLESQLMQLTMLVLVDQEFLIRFQERQPFMAAAVELLFMEPMQSGLVLAASVAVQMQPELAWVLQVLQILVVAEVVVIHKVVELAVLELSSFVIPLVPLVRQ